MSRVREKVDVTKDFVWDFALEGTIAAGWVWTAEAILGCLYCDLSTGMLFGKGSEGQFKVRWVAGSSDETQLL